jgi:DNA-binding NtrC family response regulator
MSDKVELAVLVVDDDSGFRDSVRRLLWLNGDRLPAAVLEAANGDEALDIVRRRTVDCVLLDHRMPGRMGVDLIPALLDTDPHLPVIMVTGTGDEPTAVAAMKNGAADYLVKGTVSADALIRSIRNALEKRGLRRALEEQRLALLEAERQRVMVESLAAVCHHLGQPITVISTCLQMMKRPDAAVIPDLMAQCAQAADAAHAIMKKIQALCVYRSEPYLPAGGGEAAKGSDRILAMP